MHNEAFDNILTDGADSDEHTFLEYIDTSNLGTSARYICQTYEDISHIDIDNFYKGSDYIKLYVKYNNTSSLHYTSRNIRTDIPFDDIMQANDSNRADLLVDRCWEVLRKVERSLSPTDIELFTHNIVRTDTNTFVCSACDATHSFNDTPYDITQYDYDERQLMLRYLLAQFLREPCWRSLPNSCK
jgi:hypothetical protein